MGLGIQRTASLSVVMCSERAIGGANNFFLFILYVIFIVQYRDTIKNSITLLADSSIA